MKLLKLKIICCFIIIGATFGYAQGIMQLQPNDTLPSIVQDSLILVVDTIVEGDSIMKPPIKDDSLAMPMSVVVVTDSSDLPMMLEIREFQPNPTKAVIYAAIFPGLDKYIIGSIGNYQ